MPNRIGLPQIFLVIPTRPDGYWKDGVFTRLTELDLKTIEQAFKDGAAHEFDALEFLAELSAHIPKTYESLTR